MDMADPAGAYILLIIILAAISFTLFVALLVMVHRYQEVTRDSIKGFSDILAALNAIRSDIQQGDNALMGKVGDGQKGLNEKLEQIKDDVLAHLQYIRDKIK